MPIQVYNYQTMSALDKSRIFKRSSVDYDLIKREIAPVIKQVKDNSDQAIFDINQQFSCPVTNIQVTKDEFDTAKSAVSSEFKRALQQAIRNIKTVSQAQRQQLRSQQDTVEVQIGITVWRAWKPIDKIGIYVPGSSICYPSTLLMTAIPAQIAGCQNIIICTPPNSQGQIAAEILYATRKLGLDKVYKVGGPAAIAAMAYGTETIPAVSKIVGPGNQYTTAAKLLVYPTVDIDMPAGPSENLIIADDTANPSFVAADLMADCEHGPDSAGVLVTDSFDLAQKVRSEMKRLLPQLDTQSTIRKSLEKYGAIIITKNLSQAITLANEYAPEHMQIMTATGDEIAEKITNAGSIFIGKYTAKSSGDYATGATHVLPTGQGAKVFSPLSVDTFGRLIQYQKVSKPGLNALAQTITTFADVENLPAHKLSCQIRFN